MKNDHHHHHHHALTRAVEGLTEINSNSDNNYYYNK
jgi:hypothetical protein